MELYIERLSNFLPTLPVWLVQKIRESCLFSVIVIIIENKQNLSVLSLYFIAFMTLLNRDFDTCSIPRTRDFC